MPERAILRAHFSALLAQVRTTAGQYERLALSTDDPEARNHLQRLAREEQRHVMLTERLLEIVDE